LNFYGCSRFLKNFLGPPPGKKDYSGFEVINWPTQTNEYQPKVAECPKNPHTFLPAGISHSTHKMAHFTVSTAVYFPLHTVKEIPAQKS